MRGRKQVHAAIAGGLALLLPAVVAHGGGPGRPTGLLTGTWGDEAATVREVARKLGVAEGDGAPLAGFAAVWFHRDDAAPPPEPEVIAALSNFVASGRGLLLSGAAVTMVNALGVDTLRTKPLTFGHDRAQAGLVPVEPDHPAFRGLETDRGAVWLSNAAFPAFADVQHGGGMVLARTPGGPANPLVEYRLGRGRIVACGWRFSPLYFHAPGTYCDNLERLLGNLLGYLRDAPDWSPGAPRARPAVTEAGFEALSLAIADLTGTFGERYPRGPEFRERLARLRQAPVADEFRKLRDEALLANPLLDFERLLLVRRSADKPGLPMNTYGNCGLDTAGYTNDIAVLSPVRPGGRVTTLHRPGGGRFAGDVKLHFDADRLLFSATDAAGRWRVQEINVDGTGLRTLPLIDEPDVDNYDACYLPDGRIIFSSTAPFTGVPCVRGSSHVANLYRLETDGRIRRLTVEQDHDWCPTVLPDGRVLYQRWEYTDIPHAFSRILFHMNPDGTEQMEFYGSNSYWPNSMFYAKPLPGRSGRFVAIVGGHHELPRMGDLVLFDTARGRHEADGAVQRIPGRGRKVEPVMLDLPIAQTWPKFLHPFPLGDNYFLVSCKPSEDEPWGIWLADVFDNLVPIHAEPGFALFEPVPIRKVARPPVLADKVDLNRGDADVFLADIYTGPGLAGVPRGTIKALRILGYHFAYQGMGGEPDAPGLDGPWDVKRILGTVPVHEDGSAHFRIPALTPIALQPLDAEGKAVQLMRSWLTAMPGETVSCVGCHERQNSTLPARTSLAAAQPAAAIAPWYGPARGFDFRREVQPVLDRWCVGCHDGKTQHDGKPVCDLTDRPDVPMQDNRNAYNLASHFSPSYYKLRRLVRTPTRESDMHLLPPWEFHADTTRLVQMLRKGHHDVVLDAEAWDRIVTWIDLGAPAHGTWTDICGTHRVRHQAERRRELHRRYAGMDEDPEAVLTLPACVGSKFQVPGPKSASETPRLIARAAPRVAHPESRILNLGPGVSLELVRIPSGEFVMGDAGGEADERPPAVVKIAGDFWMGEFEVSNEQFALFDPAHDSRLEHGDYIHFSPGERGWSLARPRQPVVRVSWKAATEFCRWLTAKTGRRFRLPTEAEWEYACRAGTTTPFSYGTLETDFSPFANVSDITNQKIDPFGWAGRPDVIPPWRPADARFNDHARVTVSVGRYAANAWGLCDMHGNVAEWTASAFRPYPYDAADGRERPAADDRIAVRGGSWYDPPARCRSAFRQRYLPDQGVYDVGFRVACDNPAGD